jgi:hypothetical protein
MQHHATHYLPHDHRASRWPISDVFNLYTYELLNIFLNALAFA